MVILRQLPKDLIWSMDKKSIRTILKFDVGADGFKKMIYVLAIGAVIVLIAGIFFLNTLIKEMRVIS